MKKILFLDFDGVLFDTLDEAYQVCIHTKTFKNKFFSDSNFKLFKTYRSLVGPAWNYYYILNAILNGISPKLKKFEYTEEAKVFEKDFFLTRTKLKKNNYKNWLALNKKYHFLNELERVISKNIDIYIITTKDKQTVLDLLQENNIEWISSKKIFGQETFSQYGSKREVILSVLINNAYTAIFLDDLYTHLKACENIQNLQLIQPNWGYIDKKSQYIYNVHDVLSIIKDLGGSL